MSIEGNGPGIRTRVLLLTSLVIVIAGTTVSSLLIVRGSLRQQVQKNLSLDLRHSEETFEDLAALRLSALERESALLASLPSLKALMTTNDQKTVADDAEDFWKLSGNDLFGLADADRRVLVVKAQGAENTDSLKTDLQAVMGDQAKRYLLSGSRLYEYSVHPLYFGSNSSGTLLGYVISGYAIDHRFLIEVGRGAGAEAAFLAAHTLAESTLTKERQETLQAQIGALEGQGAQTIAIGRERFLAVGRDMTAGASAPLRLVVMKSFDEEDRAEREINRLIFLASLLAIAGGALLMLLLARMVTRPLELLAAGVRAFGEGDPQFSLPRGGTQEVRYLSRVFAEMRDEIQRKNAALLESERLATIGRMASSVSHDLRHYLAAVYANAEFLASPALPAGERQELFEEIRLAVNGTTEMLDSLLIFGRTGAALQRMPTTMASLVERALTLVRTHPDAQQVLVRMEKTQAETTALLDAKQIERAIYNLLLNACQSARESSSLREVHVSLSADETKVSVTICDTGLGVPENIRESMFDPFVSEGKQKGTGLGLTLAWCVAKEHEGDVKLMSSRPGETIFQLTVSRGIDLPGNNEVKRIPSTQLA